jgi:hypothetical protein
MCSSEVQQAARPKTDGRVGTLPCCRRKPTSPQPQIIDEQPGPVVTAGHTRGGAVITGAASHERRWSLREPAPGQAPSITDAEHRNRMS